MYSLRLLGMKNGLLIIVEIYLKGASLHVIFGKSSAFIYIYG